MSIPICYSNANKKGDYQKETISRTHPGKKGKKSPSL